MQAQIRLFTLPFTNYQFLEEKQFSQTHRCVVLVGVRPLYSLFIKEKRVFSGRRS